MGQTCLSREAIDFYICYRSADIVRHGCIDAMTVIQTCPRPYSEWREDHGDVLWYLWPIVKTPWTGSPYDIGEMVKTSSTTHIGAEVFESTKFGRTGGWPWRDATDDTLARLWWVSLPDSSELDKSIRDHIRGGPDPFNN